MTASTRPDALAGDGSRGYAWATGIGAFAGIVLATAGVFQFLEGLSAVLSDDVFVAPRHYVFDFNLTSWGWIHLVVGVLAVGVGISIVVGWPWGYSIGVLIGFLSALSNFAFIPYYPLWGSIVLALDIIVIWALCRLMRREAALRTSRDAAQRRPM